MKRAIFPDEGTTLRRAAKSVLPDCKLDRSSRDPLHRQLYDWLRRAIVGGDLPPGYRLPSTRALARTLGVSRNLVLDTYEALSLEGLLVGQTGSGTYVRGTLSGIVHFQMPGIPDPQTLFREAHYPAETARLRDPEGNVLYLATPMPAVGR